MLAAPWFVLEPAGSAARLGITGAAIEAILTDLSGRLRLASVDAGEVDVQWPVWVMRMPRAVAGVDGWETPVSEGWVMLNRGEWCQGGHYEPTPHT